MATTTDAPADGLADMIDQMMHPYRGKMIEFTRLPATGLARRDVLGTMEDLRAQEEAKWKNGFASGAVYNGDQRARRVRQPCLRAAFAGQSAAHRPLAECGQVRGGDRLDDGPHAEWRRGRRPGGERRRSLRLGHVGRLGEHPARDEDVSRLGPRHQGYHRTGDWSSPSPAHAAFHKAAQYFNLKLPP